MPRIFLTLAGISGILLIGTFALGWMVGDIRTPEGATGAAFNYHFLSAVAAVIFATLVHAIVLTYFMGTGRWLEETVHAYKLPLDLRVKNQKLKYRAIPAMVGAVFLLIILGSTGVAMDPGSAVDFRDLWGIPAATIHFVLASITLLVNFGVNWLEYQAIARNGQIIEHVVAEVRRIRLERGLPV